MLDSLNRGMDQITSYDYDIRPNARLRVWLKTERGELASFAVTLEYEVQTNDWRAVARFDNSGGNIHRDRLRPDGSYLAHREPVRLGSTLTEAIANAQREFGARADGYLEAFEKMLKSTGET